MSVGFNLSTSREDVSNRLRSQNLRRAKAETEKLETESKKMHERLKELKMAMSREKEERERQGGGFWKSGQTGNLGSYPDDVLKKKARDSGRRKIKVLKDKPLDIPERSSQPGTMAFIAKKGSCLTPRNRPKGPRCGQCEEKTAAVSCVQCAEDYCAGCFAAFHLRGSLKKHRSVPLSATGPRKCMSPRPSPRPPSDSFSNECAAEGPISQAISFNSTYEKNRNDPEGASGSYDGVKNSSRYNEDESAASFQEALQAWRNGKVANQDPSPRPVCSPVKTPVVSVDSGTETMAVTPGEVDIKFNTHSLSYAEKLMLKRHRRTELESLFTPHSGNQSTSPRQSISPAIIHSVTASRSYGRENTENRDSIIDSSVSFQSLYEAVATSTSPNVQKSISGNFSIVELSNTSLEDMPQVHERVSYKVQEVDSMEAWEVEHSGKPPRSLYRPKLFDETEPSPRLPRDELGHRYLKVKSNKLNNDGDIFIEDIESDEQLRASSGKSARKQESSSAKSRRKNVDENMIIDSKQKTVSAIVDESVKENIESVLKRKQSATRRPPSGNRPKSSRNQSRPGSRAKSRAASRMGSEGHLTKTPSTSLSMVARMTVEMENIKHGHGLGDFFTMGVKPVTRERTLTPRTGRPMSSKENEVKISNRLYQMAPRSWHPENSLAESVPVDQVHVEEWAKKVEHENQNILSYTYSEEVGHCVTLVNTDRHSALDFRGEARSKTTRERNATKYHSRQSPIGGRPESRPKSTDLHETSGRTSRAIVVHGDDMSLFDETEQQTRQNKEDKETLDQLEWELASQSGRLTADGKLSRMTMMEDIDEDYSGSCLDSSRSIGRLSQSEGYDINSRLREDELADLFDSDNEDEEDHEDVRALN